MPAKEQRNKLIINLWKQGKRNPEILTGLKRAGYKDLKNTKSLTGVLARLKRAGELLGERQITRKPEKKITRKPEIQKRIKVTFQLSEDLFFQIKIKALEERKRISEFVEGIFEEYLK